MVNYPIEIALKGLAIKAIKLNPDNPFQWASGYRMPIYNDNRMFLFFPDCRDLITEGFNYLIDSLSVNPDVIAGTSTAGIPWGMSLANKLDKPFIYIRDKPKDHGLKNQIEGIDAEKNLENRNVVVIEDLISTGGSSARAVQAVRNANGNCNYCLSIFDYGLDKAVQAFNSLDPKCKVSSLLDYYTLLEVAKQNKNLTEKQVGLLEEWRADPFNWGEKHGFSKN
ncbi:MAG: orotate phosphoribosyltransferase [Nanoarchaeota archaeon]|nr:orotate phosphoribosyltransferase [Nanoarchaeota archaeon]